MPELVDLVTHTSGAALLPRLVAGIDRRRPLSRFAPMTLQEWLARRGGPAHPYGPPVLLPDTLTNHFHTQAGSCSIRTACGRARSAEYRMADAQV